MTTEILSLGEITSAQDGKEIVFNLDIRKLEAMLIRVISKTNGGPPAGTDGDTYIVDVASGAWASFALGSIAHKQAGTWYNYTVFEGLRLWVNDQNKEYVNLGTGGTAAWVELAGASSGVSGFTAGSVLFVGSGGVFAQDNTNLFYDDTNDRLGLGRNSSLTARLDVKQITAGQKGARFELADNTAAVFEVLENANSYLKLDTTNSSEAISFGNTTTNPVYNFLGTGLATFSGSVTVAGSLTVNGTLTTINTTNMDVTDSIITLGNGNTGTTIDGGFIFERNSGNNVAFFYDESADEFVCANTTSDADLVTQIVIGTYADFHAGALSLTGNIDAHKTSGTMTAEFRTDSGLALFIVNGTTQAVADFRSGATTYWRYGVEIGALSEALQFNSSGAFSTVGELTIRRAGNIGIYSSSPTVSTGHGLEIQNVSANSTLRVSRTTTGAAIGEFRTGSAQIELDTVGAFPLLLQTNGTTAVSVSSTQAVTINSEPALRGPYAYKVSNESLTSTTTLQDDDELTISLQASTSYNFRIVGFANNAGAVAGLKLALGGTVGILNIKGQISIYDDTTNTLVAFDRVTALATGVGAALGTGNSYFLIEGALTTTTAGTFLLSWAQNVSDGSATTVQRQSSMVVTKVQ